jgi:RNA polymerase sigma-70 factor (ECF subfamily)
LVIAAHGQDADQAKRSRAELAGRYLGAVYRYLVAVVRDTDVADELCQQFALKLLEGEFHRAHPARGQFRKYIKTALINLIRQNQTSVRNRPTALPEHLATQEIATSDGFEDREFTRRWRDEVMNHTWSALQQQRPVFHDLLRLRLEHPDSTSRELADEYSLKQNKPMTAANVRKTLERAHTRFADLLVEEVAASLIDPDVDQLRLELEELDLLKYCRSAVQRWAQKSAKG